MTLIDEETEAPEVPEVEIAGPGVYEMPEEQYHARPELNASGMCRLLEVCPSLWKWEKANPTQKGAYDFGKALHALVLGAGAEVEVLKNDDGVPFQNMLTNAAKQAKADAYEAGRVPILEKDYAHVKAMAWQIQRHPLARQLLTDGKPEQSLFWNDAKTGEPLRARVDWLREPGTGRLILIDLKSTDQGLDPESLGKTIYKYGYHQRAALYREAAMELGLGGRDTVVAFIFQMKSPPYLVHVVQPPELDLVLGAARNRAAIKIFRECNAANDWYGYDGPEASRVEIPSWGRTRDQELEYLA